MSVVVRLVPIPDTFKPWETQDIQKDKEDFKGAEGFREEIPVHAPTRSIGLVFPARVRWCLGRLKGRLSRDQKEESGAKG